MGATSVAKLWPGVALSVFVAVTAFRLLAPAHAGEAGPTVEPATDASSSPVEEQTVDPVLSEVRALARAGAVGLALERLDARQPPVAMDPVAWAHWERERIHLMRSRGRWADIARRLAEPPGAASEGFRHWAWVQQAEAWIEAGEPRRARELARDRIWAEQPLPVDVLEELRRQIVRAYQAEGQDAAARTALQRQFLDHPEDRAGLSGLQARLYLAEGRPADAFAGLPQDSEDPELVLLRRLAGLRAGQLPPGQVLEASVEAASGDLEDRLAEAHWAVAAQAAERLGNPVTRVSALEHSLSRSRPRGGARDPLLGRSGDDLWDAYLELGEDLGNRLQLIRGDDEAWLEAAETRAGEQAVEARALAAVVGMEGGRRSLRDQAHHMLAGPLYEMAGGGRILYQLYLDTARFGTASEVPIPVRYLLVDYVLEMPDIPLASELMAGLTAPPEGADPAQWLLRRARVLILGGRVEEGLEPVMTLVGHPGSVDVDRLLQVLFDLQSLERHEAAAHVLSRLQAWPLEPSQRREILYWTADSAAALGDHSEAARLYLRSATLLDPVAMDPWAQTARYRAAEQLAAVGQVEDARALYQGLLGATRDPARQAMLRHELQQLVLAQSKAESKAQAKDQSNE